jgi:hypothetical protein
MRPTDQHGCCLRAGRGATSHTAFPRLVFGWLLVAASGLLGQCGESPIRCEFSGFINWEVSIASQSS